MGLGGQARGPEQGGSLGWWDQAEFPVWRLWRGVCAFCARQEPICAARSRAPTRTILWPLPAGTWREGVRPVLRSLILALPRAPFTWSYLHGPAGAYNRSHTHLSPPRTENKHTCPPTCSCACAVMAADTAAHAADLPSMPPLGETPLKACWQASGLGAGTPLGYA